MCNAIAAYSGCFILSVLKNVAMWFASVTLQPLTDSPYTFMDGGIFIKIVSVAAGF